LGEVGGSGEKGGGEKVCHEKGRFTGGLDGGTHERK